ncbi:MAG: DNA repair protein RecO [Patescibacteria group bacterium]|jgi:DNA repair protein RecO (recombination protein O)
MKSYSLDCFVLRSVNYRDSDKIYTLYSKEVGKLSAMAKGVRKITSRRAGSLDTLNHVTIGVHESQSDFRFITETRLDESFENIKKDLKTSAYGYYISELIFKNVDENEKTEEHFNFILKTLRAINKEPENVSKYVNFFEKNFMKLLGYQMSLDKCVFCGKRYESSWPEIRFNYDLGGLCCGDCEGRGVLIKRSEIDMAIKSYVRQKLGVNFVSLETFGNAVMDK